MEKKPLCTFDDKENEKKRRKKFKNVFESIKKGIAVMLFHCDEFPELPTDGDVESLCNYTTALTELARTCVEIIKSKYSLDEKKVKKRQKIEKV